MKSCKPQQTQNRSKKGSSSCKSHCSVGVIHRSTKNQYITYRCIHSLHDLGTGDVRLGIRDKNCFSWGFRYLLRNLSKCTASILAPKLDFAFLHMHIYDLLSLSLSFSLSLLISAWESYLFLFFPLIIACSVEAELCFFYLDRYGYECLECEEASLIAQP